MQNQQLLGSVLRSLFPSYRIFSNARKTAANLNPSTHQWLEVDYHIPDLKLAFEFQDVYHFTTSYYARVPVDFVQQRDYFKAQRLREKGETLISVPCWWDGLPNSLVATIRAVRSDLLSRFSKNNSSPIPPSPPHNFFTEFVPDVGELMISSYAFPSLVKSLRAWWMSEKYDGIRACWNSTRRELFSRSGRRFNLPNVFTSHFPSADSAVFLDCELWFGRGSFRESQILALDFRNNSNSQLPHPETVSKTHWLSLRAVSFDRIIPSYDKNIQTNNYEEEKEDKFEHRFRDLLLAIPHHHPFITIAYNIKATPFQLNTISTTIMEDGGEGVMLRAPNTPYQSGISPNLLKLKAQRDHEALVVDYDGHHYELELSDGTRFKAPTAPGVSISLGDVVTFTYSFSKNEEKIITEDKNEQRVGETWIPLDPVIAYVRKDVVWEEMIEDYNVKSRERSANTLTQRLMKDTKVRHPVGHWTREDNKNAKDLFIQFARARNGSAHNPEFWYSVKRNELLKEKRTTTIVKNYGGSCARAVLDLFPDIGLDQKRLFHHKAIRVKKSRSNVFKVALHKSVKTVLKTSGIMKIWWKVHKNSVA